MQRLNGRPRSRVQLIDDPRGDFFFLIVDTRGLCLTDGHKNTVARTTEKALAAIAGVDQTGVMAYALNPPTANISYDAFLQKVERNGNSQLQAAYNELSGPLEQSTLRWRHVLIKLGCATLADACQFNLRFLLSCKGFGISGFQELYKLFARRGLFPWGPLDPKQIRTTYAEVKDLPNRPPRHARNASD